MAPEFKPGMFEPVITVGQVSDGATRAFHGDKSGLFECADGTFSAAFSTASARGANMDLSRSSVKDLSKIFGQFLWARNLANQLSKVSINNGFAREILRDLEIPEPLIKLFNAYGHFEHDMATYVNLDLERTFAYAILDLAYMVQDTRLDDDEITVLEPPEHVNLPDLGLSPNGDIVFDRHASLQVYLNKLLGHIVSLQIPGDRRLQLIKTISDIATERDLTFALRWLRMQQDTGNIPQRDYDPQRPIADRDFFTSVLGEHQDTSHGAVLNKRVLLQAIRRSSDIMRSLNDELCVVVAALPIPKYEKGSAAQASETIEDITFSHFPLSLADATVSAAFRVGKVLRRFLRAAPDDVDSGLQTELIRKSIRRRG